MVRERRTTRNLVCSVAPKSSLTMQGSLTYTLSPTRYGSLVRNNFREMHAFSSPMGALFMIPGWVQVHLWPNMVRETRTTRNLVCSVAPKSSPILLQVLLHPCVPYLYFPAMHRNAISGQRRDSEWRKKEREGARQRGRRECIVDWGEEEERTIVALNQNWVWFEAHPQV